MVMRRNKCGGRGSTNKRDTPVKVALSRRDKHRRLPAARHTEAFPEEPEVEERLVPAVKPSSPVWTDIKPELLFNSPAYPENPRRKAASPASPADEKPGRQLSPARHPAAARVTPDPAAFKGGETPVKDEEQHLAVTPGSVTSSSMETDGALSFDHHDDDDDDDDEEDCCSSASSSTSSLPSPEIFRKDSCVETLTFSNMEDLLGLHLHIKNSTLLDVSHAAPIHMHHTPNLSSIAGPSWINVENKCENSNHRRSEAETETQTASFKSDTQTEALEWKTPVKAKSSGCFLQRTNRRPILCKKKVSFKTPILAETFERKHPPATESAIHDASGSAQTSGPAPPAKPDAETSRAAGINPEDDSLCLRVTLRRPVESSPEKAKFFDFVSDSDRDVFFQRMRDRCVKLRSTPVFPLTAAEHSDASVLCHLKPKHCV